MKLGRKTNPIKFKERASNVTNDLLLRAECYGVVLADRKRARQIRAECVGMKEVLKQVLQDHGGESRGLLLQWDS